MPAVSSIANEWKIEQWNREDLHKMEIDKEKDIDLCTLVIPSYFLSLPCKNKQYPQEKTEGIAISIAE